MATSKDDQMNASSRTPRRQHQSNTKNAGWGKKDKHPKGEEFDPEESRIWKKQKKRSQPIIQTHADSRIEALNTTT